MELIVKESFTELNTLFRQHMRWFNKAQQHLIPRELYIFESPNQGRVAKTCLTCDDRELLLERSASLGKRDKIIQFELVKQYCKYGFNFQADKTIKKLVAEYPTDPDVWFELFLFHSSLTRKGELASESLGMSIKLHFKAFGFEYEGHRSFLVNLSRFLFSLMMRKHTLERVVYKTEQDKKGAKTRERNNR